MRNNPTSLNKYTTEQLQAELERRKVACEAPAPIAEPDFSKLIKRVTEYVNGLSEEDSDDDDSEHYIYEHAVEAVYGPSIWQWINNIDEYR